MKHLFQKIALIAAFIPAITFAHLPTSQENNTNSIAPMLQKVTPAVVNIFVESMTLTKLDQLIQTQDNHTKIPLKSYAVGTGVIFNAEKDLIVTNAHVIKNEKLIIVTLKNGERYHAKLIAKDANYDVAILQIHAEHLTALPFADSDDVKVGDFVTAIGSPYGLSQTVTSGVISAINRTHPQIEGYQSFIQTDAPINPGNSGGALVNMSGQLIGINTALVGPTDANSGIGFAIPSNMVQGVIEQLLKYGKVERGVLGVLVQDITSPLASAMDLKETKGAIISEILPNTPAATAGLQPKDIIIKMNNDDIRSADQLRNLMGLIRPGTKVNITVIRDHQTKVMTAEVANPKKLKSPVIPYFGGMRLQDFHELETDGKELHGVIVTGMSDSSDGALAGLQRGDVITDIDFKPVTSLKTLQAAMLNQTKPIVLSVVHGNSHVFLVLRAN